MVRDAEIPLLLAAEQAVERGAQLLRRGRRHVGALIAKGDRDFATAVDLQVERAIRDTLGTTTPDIPILGEEQGGGSVIEDSPLWVLDPIDGTVNFAHDSPLCAVSLALVVDGESRLGIIDLPLVGEKFVALAGRGSFLNGKRISVAPQRELREAVVGVTDFAVGPAAKRENPVHLGILKRLAVASLRVRVHGSEALDLAWLGAGRLDASLMLSNLPWDVGAGVLVAREAGADVYDHDGSPYGPRSRFTIASSPPLRAELLALVAGAMSEGLGAAHV
jgi:myo-inositol-1(or 4)-monophosphatase